MQEQDVDFSSAAELASDDWKFKLEILNFKIYIIVDNYISHLFFSQESRIFFSFLTNCKKRVFSKADF